jgi:hypothetical protein
MSKKLITACMALVAFAALAVMPAVASATNDPELTHPTGTLLAEGTKITATNVGETLLKSGDGSSILARCTHATMTGTLTKNKENTVEGTIDTATFEGTGGFLNGMNECTGSFGNLTVTTNGGGVDGETVENGTPWCVRSTPTMATDEFQVRGGACGTATRKITFVFDTTIFGGTTQCKYERASTEPIKGTYTTDSPSTDALMHLAAGANTKFVGESGNSFVCPTSGTLEMTFTLKTDTTPTAEPLYFS